MQVKDFKKLFIGLNEDVEIVISGKAVCRFYGIDNDSNWWDIKGLDSTIKEGNNFGQVVVILSDTPVME